MTTSDLFEHSEFGDRYNLEDYNSLRMSDFIPTWGCGLFQPEDLFKIMAYRIRIPFGLLWFKKDGRERSFQFGGPLDNNEFVFEIHSSGYGDIQERIVFNESFPEDLKFRICKEMAEDSIRTELKVISKSYLQGEILQDYIKKERSILENFLEKINSVVSFQALKTLTEDTMRKKKENLDEKERRKKEQGNTLGGMNMTEKTMVDKEYVRELTKSIIEKVDPNMSPSSEEFKIATILLTALYVSADTKKIADFLDIDEDEVRQYEYNLRNNGVWVDEKTACDWQTEDGNISFLCDIMVAQGLLSRKEDDKEE